MAEPAGITSTNISTGALPSAASGVSPHTNTASVSNWAQPYVTDMLGTASTLADKPFTPYTGQLTAGSTQTQTNALQGIGGLTVPTNQTWSALDQGQRQQFMSPYVKDVLDPQIAEAKRQSEIQNLQNRSQLTKAGAYGGGRQAIRDSEAQRNLQQNLAGITGKGYQSAYEQGLAQFNTEQNQKLNASKAAQDLYANQYQMGEQERKIQQEGLGSAYAQWQQEKQYPYDQLKFQQSMLQGLPLTTQTVARPPMSTLDKVNAVGTQAMGLLKLAKDAGIVDRNSSLNDLVAKGFGKLLGIGGAGSGASDPVGEQMTQYLRDQVMAGNVSFEDANAAITGNYWSEGASAADQAALGATLGISPDTMSSILQGTYYSDPSLYGTGYDEYLGGISSLVTPQSSFQTDPWSSWSSSGTSDDYAYDDWN